MRVLLIGGAKTSGEFLRQVLAESFEAVYAVDGGARHLRDLGVTPQHLLGDFDSLGPDEVQAFRESGAEIHTFPAEKDWTDMELALDLAIKNGATSVAIIGGTGERFDHTMANISLLFRAEEEGVEAFLRDENHEIRLIPPGQQIELCREQGKDFSLFPLNREVRGVRVWGAKYSLENGLFRLGETLGVHNEISARTAHIEGGDGFLLLVRFQSTQ